MNDGRATQGTKVSALAAASTVLALGAPPTSGLHDPALSKNQQAQVVAPGTLLQNRWMISRESPFFDDDAFSIIKCRDTKESRDVAIKVYKGTDPFSVQKFVRSVEVLLAFRGRFTAKGLRVEGSQNLDLLMQELRHHTNLAEYASGQSFLTHMDFRSAFVELISFSHDADWMPAVDAESNLLFIVIELPELSLRKRLSECIHQKATLSATEINEIQWALVSMTCGLMTEGYVNLDIKLTTIFKYKNAKGKDVWKLVDLDGATPYGKGARMRFSDLQYCLEYAPPELAKAYLASQREGGRCSLAPSMCVWSIGMCMMEVAALMPVYNAKYSWFEKFKEENKGANKFLASVAGQKGGLNLEKVITPELKAALAHVHPELASVMEGVLVKDENKRLTITQVLLHKWFSIRRKEVFDARWHVDGQPPEEDEEANMDEDTLELQKTLKPKKEQKEEDLLPALETQEELRAYIKAQVQGRPYEPEEKPPPPVVVTAPTRQKKAVIAPEPAEEVAAPAEETGEKGCSLM